MRSALALLSLAVLLFGCDDLRKGVDAFYAMDYGRAIHYLTPLAQNQANQTPEVTVAVDSSTTVDQAMPVATRDYFQGWHAYTGSYFALGNLPMGCKHVALSLRKIHVITKKPNGDVSSDCDPRSGEYWQGEVMALRSWWAQYGCAVILPSDEPLDGESSHNVSTQTQ